MLEDYACAGMTRGLAIANFNLNTRVPFDEVSDPAHRPRHPEDSKDGLMTSTTDYRRNVQRWNNVTTGFGVCIWQCVDEIKRYTMRLKVTPCENLLSPQTPHHGAVTR